VSEVALKLVQADKKDWEAGEGGRKVSGVYPVYRTKSHRRQIRAAMKRECVKKGKREFGFDSKHCTSTKKTTKTGGGNPRNRRIREDHAQVGIKEWNEERQ